MSRRSGAELSHVNLPLVFTAGQAVVIRMRQLLRGNGYTPWATFPMIVI